MKLLLTVLLSPMAFALGFVWPLLTQALIALALLPAGWPAIAVGGAIALAFGLMAQLRGSWVWIK